MKIRAYAAISLLACACSGPTRVAAPDGARALIGDEWFEARAKQLAISFDEARGRDRAIETAPGVENIDSFTREQAAAVWTELCSKCHGLDGEPPEPTGANPPPREWGTMGTSMGFFFGGDKMRSGIFRVISEGGERKSDGAPSVMPAWGEMLSREQIWALVYHIESL
jgi:mono/diheme cytochrome c family protein